MDNKSKTIKKYAHLSSISYPWIKLVKAVLVLCTKFAESLMIRYML